MDHGAMGNVLALLGSTEKVAQVVLGALILALTKLAIADSELVDRNYDLRRFDIRIYSKAFAERFELSATDIANDLPEELHAVEFVAERNPRSDYIHCQLKIYFQSAYSIYLPEGPSAGSRMYVREGAHFFNSPRRNAEGSWVGWTTADRIALSRGSAPYHRSAALATRDYRYQSVGAFQDMTIEEYHKEILPSVGYMKFGADCAWLSRMSHHPAGWDLWVKRQGGADYTRIVREKEADFIRWPLPDSLVARFQLVAKRLAEYNSSWRERVRPGPPTTER